MSNIQLNKNSLYNGVSQQIPELRLDNQSSVVENASLSVSRGFEKRNGTEPIYYADTETFTEETATHGFTGSDGVNYIVTVNQPTGVDDTVSISVLDTAGNSYKVIGDTSYLNCDNPHKDLRFVTIGDTVIVSNTGQVVTLDPSSGYTGSQGELVSTLYDEIDDTDWDSDPTYNGSDHRSEVRSDNNALIFDIERRSGNTVDPRVFLMSNLDLSGDDNKLELGSYKFKDTNNVDKFGAVGLWVDSVFHSYVYFFTGKGENGDKVTIDLPTVAGVSQLGIVGNIYSDDSIYKTKIKLFNTFRVTSKLQNDETTIGAYLWFKNGVQQVTRDVEFWNVGTPAFNSPKKTNNDTEALVDEFVSYVAGAGSTSQVAKISNSVARLVEPDATEADKLMKATDSYADTTMTVCHLKGASIESLPPVASDGDIVKIEDLDLNSTYYLQYNAQKGFWSECPGINTQTQLLATTMPHKLTVRVATEDIPSESVVAGETIFEVETIDWAGRVTGDEELSPSPSFVSRTIRDVFFYKNRLGFVTSDTVVCSAIDDLFNFYPKTVKEVFDDDPIDLTVSSNESVQLQFASVFPDSMVITGDNIQYTLHSDGKPFTTANATLDIMSKYKTADNVRPASTGGSLFLMLPIDDFVSIRDFKVATDTLIAESSAITDHVSSYIPNSVKKVLAENNLESLFLLATGDPKTLYVYNWLDQDNRRVQSAWSKWTFAFDIIDILSFDNELYIITKDEVRDVASISNSVVDSIQKISVEKTTPPTNVFANYRPLMDSMSLVPTTDVYYIDNSYGQPISTVLRVGEDTFYSIIKVGSDARIVDRVTGVGYPVTSFADYTDPGYSEPGYYLWCDMPPFATQEIPNDIDPPNYDLNVFSAKNIPDGSASRIHIQKIDTVNNLFDTDDYTISVVQQPERGSVAEDDQGRWFFYSEPGSSYTATFTIEYTLLGLTKQSIVTVNVEATGYVEDNTNTDPSIYVTYGLPFDATDISLFKIVSVDDTTPGELTITTDKAFVMAPDPVNDRIHFLNILGGGDDLDGINNLFHEFTLVSNSPVFEFTVTVDETNASYINSQSYCYLEVPLPNNLGVTKYPGDKFELRPFVALTLNATSETEEYKLQYHGSYSGIDGLYFIQKTTLYDPTVSPTDYSTYATQYLLGYRGTNDYDDEVFVRNNGVTSTLQDDIGILSGNISDTRYVELNGDISIPANRDFNLDPFLGYYNVDLKNNITITQGRDWVSWT